MICPECFSKKYRLNKNAPTPGTCVCPDCGHEEKQFSRTVYICSPLRGNGITSMEQHLELAKSISRRVLLEQRRIPITPHLYFTTFLDDAVQEERELGMAAGQALLERVDEVWVFPVQGYVSEGMRAEMELLKKINKPYRLIASPEEFLS